MLLLNSLACRIRNSLNGTLKENIFFLHIPKCGGSSITHGISRHYVNLNPRCDNAIVSLDEYASRKAAKMLDYADPPVHVPAIEHSIFKFREELLLYFMGQPHVHYISGHFLFSEKAYREFHKKYVFVTVLRDPVKRWISSYFYNRHRKSDWEDIEGYVKRHSRSKGDESQKYEQGSKGYEYVRFLCGVEQGIDYTSQKAIDQAKQNLEKFGIVGILEKQDHFLAQFQNRFGKTLHLQKMNQNPIQDAHQKSILNETIEEQIRFMCKPDYEIYNHAINMINA